MGEGRRERGGGRGEEGEERMGEEGRRERGGSGTKEVHTH